MADVDVGLSARRRLREPLARRLPAPADGAVTRIAATPAERNGAVPADGGSVAAALRDEPEVWAALRTGLRDYVDKNRFRRARRAVGRDRLRADRRPGRGRPRAGAGHGRRDAVLHSSPESLAGAQELAESLAVRLLALPIAPVTAAFDEVLAEEFAGREPDITEENLQARARGTL